MNHRILKESIQQVQKDDGACSEG